jgi:hypothetical protein
MPETIHDLEVIQSDTKTYKISVVDDNTPVDITGYTLFFTVKTSLNDTDTSAIISKTVICPINSDSTAGNGYILLSSTDTNKNPGNYSYDIKIQAPGVVFRKTVVSGKYKINMTSTRRTS